MGNKTNPALNALGFGVPGSSMTEAGLVDTLIQEFQTQVGQAENLVSRPVSKRQRLGMAAVLADVLTRYYATHNDEAADLWRERARRYYRRAFDRPNALVEKIGGKMT